MRHPSWSCFPGVVQMEREAVAVHTQTLQRSNHSFMPTCACMSTLIVRGMPTLSARSLASLHPCCHHHRHLKLNRRTAVTTATPSRLSSHCKCVMPSTTTTAVQLLSNLHPRPVAATTTTAAAQMLSDMGFLDSLRAFDKDNIDPAVIVKLQPLLKHSDFQPAKIKKVPAFLTWMPMWKWGSVWAGTDPAGSTQVWG
eukprot:364207-Chlamydomonas_euryale.AAC.12